MLRRATAGFLAIAAALGVACNVGVGGQDVVVHEERRFTFEGTPEITLRTFDGTLEVQSWDRNEVLLDIQRGGASVDEASALRVETLQDGTRLTITAPNPQAAREDGVRLGRWASRKVSFVLTVPRRLTIDARTGDGPITVRDVTGTLVLHSGDGAVRGERLSGTVTVDTGDGPVALADVVGSVDLRTGDGGVEVSGRFDSVRISTGDGPVHVEARDASEMRTEWTITTGDGPISLRLPAEFDAELDAYTGDGPVTASGIASGTPERPDDRGLLRRRLGNGGQLLRLRSGDGPISVTR